MVMVSGCGHCVMVAQVDLWQPHKHLRVEGRQQMPSLWMTLVKWEGAHEWQRAEWGDGAQVVTRGAWHSRDQDRASRSSLHWAWQAVRELF